MRLVCMYVSGIRSTVHRPLAIDLVTLLFHYSLNAKWYYSYREMNASFGIVGWIIPLSEYSTLSLE